MLYAIYKDEKIEASPKAEGYCPACNELMLPKCGEVKVWHWSHFANKDCDFTKETETEWHIEWKKLFPKEQAEKVIRKKGKTHIADIKTAYGMVIEFQHSTISWKDIRDREGFYGFMVWVFDAQEAYANDRIISYHAGHHKNPYGCDFLRWEHPKKQWLSCQKPVFLDLDGDSLFRPNGERFWDYDDNHFETSVDVLGDYIAKEELLDDWKHIPTNCVRWCNYNDRVNRVHLEVCQWHTEKNDPVCEKCKGGVPFLVDEIQSCLEIQINLAVKETGEM